MEQEQLWHDTLESALWSTAERIGPKKLGSEMFPEMSPEDAAKVIARWCNTERPEKPSPSQIEYIARRGREHDCHIVMHYLAQSCGYAEPEPVNPEDERAKLQRQFIDAVGELRAIEKRMERVG